MSNYPIRLILRCFTSAAILALSTCFPAIAEESFRVCADPRNPPFSDRERRGFENKIAELFAKQLDQTVEYTWFPQRIGFIRNTLKAKLPNKNSYKCDVVIGIPTGYEMAVTTKPYYRSVYSLIFLKNQGWDDVKDSADLTMLPPKRKSELRFAMFDRGPGTTWIVTNGFVEQGVPYQSMTGDPTTNSAMTIENDLKAGKINMAILWGPMAGYLVSNSASETYTLIPMQTGPGMKFDFPISMGVRFGDQERKEQLNEMIDENDDEILEILKTYNIPLIDGNGRLVFAPGQ